MISTNKIKYNTNTLKFKLSYTAIGLGLFCCVFSDGKNTTCNSHGPHQAHAYYRPARQADREASNLPALSQSHTHNRTSLTSRVEHGRKIGVPLPCILTDIDESRSYFITLSGLKSSFSEWLPWKSQVSDDDARMLVIALVSKLLASLGEALSSLA